MLRKTLKEGEETEETEKVKKRKQKRKEPAAKEWMDKHCACEGKVMKRTAGEEMDIQIRHCA